MSRRIVIVMARTVREARRCGREWGKPDDLHIPVTPRQLDLVRGMVADDLLVHHHWHSLSPEQRKRMIATVAPCFATTGGFFDQRAAVEA